ncbi:hypothetical protein [Vibrio hepatarius]|uniref:Uncharacterized protein n=1 Tax=Vibrio hepatarius TaxID=171383 RepID=A0A0M0I5T5_9VIBR|nr:hypothetical protein [Vibrio hepatarius]KOO09691.1 hypothetical protein AKJ31_04895 [Vibrio hepatarius]
MYLIELFSAKEDQVKLITFVFSALLAVGVLLTNQYFSQRRARQEYLLKKIEELAQLSIEYTDLCTEILDHIQSQRADYPTVSREHRRRLMANIRQMELIVGLYFQDSGFDPNDYHMWNMRVLDVLEKGMACDEGEVYCLFEDARQHVVDSDAKLAVICSGLVKRFGHKT